MPIFPRYSFWNCAGILKAPSLLCARIKDAWCNPIALSYPTPRHPIGIFPNDASVAILSGYIGPSAILRRVVTIRIDTFNAKFLTITSGMCPLSKRRKISPFSTNRNAPPTVSFVALHVGVPASIEHPLPNPIKRRSVLPMCLDGNAENLSLFAVSARLRCAITKVFPLWGGNPTTDASGIPKHRAVGCCIGLAEYGPPTKGLPGQVLESLERFFHTASIWIYIHIRNTILPSLHDCRASP